MLKYVRSRTDARWLKVCAGRFDYFRSDSMLNGSGYIKAVSVSRDCV